MRTTPTSPLIERTLDQLMQELSGWGSDRNLPSRRSLSKKLGVSETSINRAMEILKERGMIEASKGSRTFLPKSSKEVSTRISFWVRDRKHAMDFATARHHFHKQFHEKHPNIEIDEVQMEGTAQQNEARLIQSVLLGANPTTSPIRLTVLPFYLQNGLAAPVSSKASDGQAYLEQLSPGCRKACSRDGQLYLVPIGVSASCLYYNKGLFRKAGLDPERPPRDWEEFRTYARELSSADHGRASIHFGGALDLVWWLMQLVYEAMPQLDSDSLPIIDWNSPAARTALEWFVRLYFHENLIGVHLDSPVSMSALCLSDEIAMFCGGGHPIIRAVQMGQGEKFGVAPSPVGPNGKKLSLLDCAGWFINSHATTEQQQAAADYASAWESWQHLGPGGAEMESLGAVPLLISPLASHVEDKYRLKNMPKGWRSSLDEIESFGRWEAPRADWEKEYLGDVLTRLLKANIKLSPETIQNEFCIARREHGGALNGRLSSSGK